MIEILSFEHDTKLFMILNIYNPNIESEQVKTLKIIDTIMQKIYNLYEHNIIMGGDWNFIIDNNLDAYGGSPSLKLNSLAEYIKIKEKYELCDIFRVRNPAKKRFTFRQRTPTLSRRLDFFHYFGFNSRLCG